MTANITCRCGYQIDSHDVLVKNVADARALRTSAEVFADRHESTGDAARRPYRHETTVRLYDGVREVVL